MKEDYGAFEEILAGRKIEKVVDKDLGEVVPNAISAPTPVLEPEIKETPVVTIIDDLIEYSQKIIAKTESGLQQILKDNDNNLSLAELDKLLRMQFYDPHQSLKAPTSSSPILIKVYARDLYINSRDPRTSLFTLLHNILQQVTIIHYLLKDVWKKIMSSQKLSKKPKNMKSAKIGLNFDKRLMEILDNFVDHTMAQKPSRLEEQTIQSLVTNLDDYQAVVETLPDTEDSQSLLNMIKLLLTDQLLTQAENWERFHDQVNQYFGSPDKYLSSRYNTIMSFLPMASTSDHILRYTGLLELSPGHTKNNQVIEFRKQLERALFSHTQKLEDMAIQKENNSYLHTYDLISSNVQKSNLTKSFIISVDSLIQQSNAGGELGKLQAVISNITAGIQNLPVNQILDILDVLGTLRGVKSDTASSSLQKQAQVSLSK